MQRVLFVYLCVLGALVFVEARPRCGNNNCNQGGSGYGYTQEQYSGQNGYNGQSRYEVASNNNGGGQSEYGSGGGGSNGMYSNGAYGSHGSHGGGRFDISPYIPQDCPGCRINNLGNGNWNTHTFDIPY